jgi:FKBP-type peptidyl-prolyl cis-trans isomerase 2
MAEDSDVPRKEKRDPILMIGTIVLVLAFVVVISGYAYAQFVTPDKGPVKYGSSIEVDYVGSYYGWYDGYDDGDEKDHYRGATGTVFDTSLWSVAESQGTDEEKHDFSWEFKKRDEAAYVPFNVTVGSGGALKDFENVLIGMKVGETAYIKIENAYGEVPNAKSKKWDLVKTDFPLKETMSTATFKATFGVTVIYQDDFTGLLHPYGWKCDATYNTDGTVTVTHKVTNSETYNVNDSMTVTTSVTSATTFTTEFKFPGTTPGPKGEIKLIEFKFGEQKYYVSNVNAADFVTKSTGETTGMTLYFKITVIDFK